MKTLNKKICLLLGILILQLVACSNQQSSFDEAKIQKPQWPAAPAKARVKYLSSFSSAEDLGIKKSFWQRLGEFFTGSEDIQLVRPMAILRSGNIIYVTDAGIKGVHIFNIEENAYKLVNEAEGKALISPVALADDGEGGVYFTDSGRKKVFQINQKQDVHTLDLETEFMQPTGIARNPRSGHLYIVDTARHQVLKYNKAGGFEYSMGKRGTGNGEFNFPTMISVDKNDRLLVTDSLNFRIQVFDKLGRYVSQFGKLGYASGYQARPKGVAVDQQGNVYVIDSLFHNVQIYNQSGEYLLSVGEQGRSLGQFWLPTGIFIDKEEKIYIADSFNRRVQVLQAKAGSKSK